MSKLTFKRVFFKLKKVKKAFKLSNTSSPDPDYVEIIRGDGLVYRGRTPTYPALADGDLDVRKVNPFDTQRFEVPVSTSFVFRPVD